MEYIFCSKCGTKNTMSSNNCQNCGQLLLKPDSELPNLKNEILEIRDEYEAKFKKLLDRIEKYESAEEESKVQESDFYTSTILPKIAETESSEVVTETRDEKNETIENIIEQKPVGSEVKKDPIYSAPIPRSKVKKENPQKQEPLPNYKPATKPSKTVKEVIGSIPLLSVVFEEVGAPLLNLWSFAKKTYNNYKAKNQLPVFFMTVAGIATLLFGFGYLMQLSIGYFGELSDVVKISFGFICSASIIFWAIKLYAKSSKYKEFGSALLGLAIALNYLFIYFLSNLDNIQPALASPFTGFALIAVNTVGAIYFALRYETKIVAILSLLCGAFAPFYLNSESSSPVYFAYLWILSASAIYVAIKIKWKTLGVISFLTAASIIELAIFNDLNSFSIYTYTIIFHAFAYLFMWFSLFNGRKIVKTLSKATAVLIAGNLTLFLFNLYYLFSNSGFYTSLGFIYLLNALPFFPVLWLFKKHMSKTIKLLVMVIAGTFVAFAIPAIFDQHLIGLFWSIEALALVFLGFTFAMPSVRKEGYILLGIALVRMLLILDNLWIFGDSSYIFSTAYYNLLALGVVFSLALYILVKFNKGLVNFEKRLLVIFSNVTALWFAFTFILTAAFYTTAWLSFAGVIVAFLLITVGFFKKLNFTRILGYFVYIISIIYSAVHALIYIPEYWDTTILSTGYANLGGIGLFFIALIGLIFKLHSKDEKLWEQKLKNFILPLKELLSGWFTVLFIVTSYYFIGNYTFNLAILPMFALIYLGYKNKLVITENLGLAYSLLVILGIAFSVVETTSLRFTLQTVSGKIAMLEIMLIMWGLKTFYNRVLPDSNKAHAMHIVREIFYWIVPLIILSPIKNHAPEFIPVGLWASVFISFIIYEWTKCKSLIIEFTILAVFAASYGLILSNIYITFPASIIVLAIVFIKHKGYDSLLCYKSEFKHIFIASSYYLGACLFVLSQHILPNTSDAFIVTAVYLSTIVIFRKKIAPLRNNFLVAFWISLIFSAVSIGLKYFENSGLADQLLSFVPLIPLGIILYSKNMVNAMQQQSKWLALMFIFHVLILTSYSLILDNTWLTIAFTIHAIIVLFNSMKPNYKALVWQSIVFFAIAIIKLFFWDINHFSVSQKVIVFVFIGALLIGAAFLYMKLKDRFEEPKEDLK